MSALEMLAGGAVVAVVGLLVLILAELRGVRRDLDRLGLWVKRVG